MWKKIIRTLSLLMLCFISSLSFGATHSHLNELKLKFPDGLLGDDHGILDSSDLAINVCSARPKPFNLNSSPYPYEYWQCFESKTISFTCDGNGIPDEHEGVMAMIVASVKFNNIRHEYIEGRFWPIKDCKDFRKEATALLKGTKYACISGSFIEYEKDRSGRLTISWRFDRIKTRKGCEGHDCDFTNEFKRENCPALKL